MDRNTIIALVLILVIWLAWPKWVELTSDESRQAGAPADTTTVARQPQQASAPGESRDAAAAQQPAEHVTTEPARSVLAPAPPGGIPLREIHISAPGYEAVVSSRGASLRSWELKDYVTSVGEPVHMMPLNGRGMGVLVGEPGTRVDLGNADFRVDAEADDISVEDGDSVTVRFTCRLADGREVYKHWTFLADNYAARFSAGFADPLEAEPITVRWRGGVPSAEGGNSREVANMKALAYVGDDLEDLQVSGEPDSSEFVGLTDWVGIRNKYFLAAFAPHSADRWNVELTGRSLGDHATYGWELAPFDLTQNKVDGVVYLGPIHRDYLRPLGHNLDRAIDLGWAVIRPISKFVLWVFIEMHKVIPNYGWVIIIFSIMVKILVHPLTKKSYESTSKMQQLKPKMDEIRSKYANDQQRMNQEMMKLYKEEGFNPLGGCLPMLLQMPIIFAIYAVIGNNIEFRQAGFISWINDLSAPDVLFQLPFSIPFYGDHFALLPVLMAGSMFAQQALTITDPKQKMMIYIMPAIMLFIFNSIASGLVLYWFMFNVLSSAHQLYMTKKRKTEVAEKEAEEKKLVVQPKKSPTKKRKR